MMVSQDYTPQWKIITLCVSHGSSLKLMASPLNTSRAKLAHGTPALYIAMSKGNKDVVLSYISTLSTFAKKYSFSQRQLFTLLAAKNHENMSAVHIAIHHNHYKTVETYYAAINAISQSLSFSADELKTYL